MHYYWPFEHPNLILSDDLVERRRLSIVLGHLILVEVVVNKEE